MKVTILLVLAALLAAVTPAPSNYTDEEAVASRLAKRQYNPPTRTPPFQPPNGKYLFFLGQERDGISSFKNAVPDVLPGGITVYTNINLGGINYVDDTGGHGFVHLISIPNENPVVIIQYSILVIKIGATSFQSTQTLPSTSVTTLSVRLTPSPVQQTTTVRFVNLLGT